MKLSRCMATLLILTNLAASASAEEFDKEAIVAGYAENPILLNRLFCLGYKKHLAAYKEKVMDVVKPIMRGGNSTKKLVHDYAYAHYLRHRAEEASDIHRVDLNADFTVTREEYDHVIGLTHYDYTTRIDADRSYQKFIEKYDFNGDKQVTLDDALKGYTLESFLEAREGVLYARFIELFNYDPNHDDIITQEEWSFLIQKAFNSVDVNSDGQIAPDEKDYVCKHTRDVERGLPF
jgi:hypothetical protein